MAKNRNRQPGKKSSRTRTRQRDGSLAANFLSPPEPRGDIPKRPKRTYRTSSVRIPRPTGTYCFRQMVDKGYIHASVAGIVNNTYPIKFSDLDGFSSLGSLFDQYRIAAVTLHIVPNQNAIGLAATIQDAQPLYCVIDYDDGNNLGTQAVARQYDSVIQLAPGESCERTIAPRVETAQVVSGTPVNSISMEAPWLDCNTTGIVHYGFKTLVPQTSASATVLQSWDVFAEYFVEMRSVR